ncbi:DUF2268 domain-containing putative Zn-dependent protease [Mucilaginibacter terrae]|uniref:DUF2268 domain-containing protein n=1 Tax=Mucilaginibacter terrae TaxID=1955052 RepID=A0ABU3GS78_9SPHI|nr:DUF2268 domain-containing putative Zn-dependent protease [Mucilaginibacter terrae]MDT3402633.1 hypothetical protein [Mucilaginibacter terrae]
MKYIFLFAALLFGAQPSYAQQKPEVVIATDITNFWNAYDKITATKDSTQQLNYLNQLFINKGTPGLKAMMQVRNYTAKQYIDAINRYPLFWNSIRTNTLKAKAFASDIAINVSKLRKLYPQLKPAQVYFTMGILRSGGTTLNNNVLVGSEISMTDEYTVTSEFPDNYKNLGNFFKTNPIKSLVFTNVHEYVHTQQKSTQINTLLGQCIMEGVAEFMAVKATGQASPTFAMFKSNINTQRLKQVFARQLLNSINYGYWLYNDEQNEFNERDLGYYVGYLICQNYYNKVKDKQQAIKQMIELDYNNDADLLAFVDQSEYFNQKSSALKSQYEVSRPAVAGIKPFKNGANDVNPATTQITIEFSTGMNKRSRNFELGPLGMDNLMRVQRFIGFSDDGKQMTIEVELKPNRRYQLLLGPRFMNKDGVSINPYLIDFTTAGQ